MEQNQEVVVVDAVEVDPIIQDYTKYELDKGMATDLVRGVPEIVKERRGLLAQMNDVLALDRDNPNTARVAAKLRIAIRDNRTKGLEKWRKTTKDVYLRAGQFIDAIARKEMAINEQAESQLEAIEKHAENLKRQKLEALHAERKILVSAYVDESFNYPDLSNMDQEVFEAYLKTKKETFEARIAAEKRAEEERIERERIAQLIAKRKDVFLPLYDFWPDRTEEYPLGDFSDEKFEELHEIAKQNKLKHEQEQERIRIENEKLKEEAEAEAEKLRLFNEKVKKDLEIAEAKAKAEREKAEAVLAEERKKAQELAEKERKEKEALELQLKQEREATAALEAENKRKEAEEKLRLENLAKSGDKAILLDWVETNFKTPNSPVGLTDFGNGKILEITQKFDAFRTWALKQIEN